jgi:uncharacterized membrane protein YbhN (UPF0104 family)
MLKERVQRLVVGLVVILLVASALGYLLVPSAMLGIVGMDSNPRVTFLVRTLAAALLALPPAAWAARRRDGTSGQRSVWVPGIRSRHATCAYSWISPPSRSRRATLGAGGMTAGSAGPSGGACPNARCGRCAL